MGDNRLLVDTACPATLYIYNMEGQLVSERTLSAGSNAQSLSSLKTGSYFATLLVGGKRYVHKFNVK